MGGPSYATPYPVKRQEGGDIIWDWGKRDWVPYKRQAPSKPGPAAAPPRVGTAPGGAEPGGNPDPVSTSRSSDTPSVGVNPADAPQGREGPSVPSTGSEAANAFSSSLQRRGPRVPMPSPRRVMPAQRRAYAGANPIGRSLLGGRDV